MLTAVMRSAQSVVDPQTGKVVLSRAPQKRSGNTYSFVCPRSDHWDEMEIGTDAEFQLDFPDGLSNTFLIGEKHIPESKNGIGWWDCSTYNGDYYQCSSRTASRLYPLTTNPKDTAWKFGSKHTQVVLFCFADGHVQNIPEMTDPYILELLNQRNDGQVIPGF